LRVIKVAEDIDLRGVELIHTLLDLINPDALVRGYKVTHLTTSSGTPADLDMRVTADALDQPNPTPRSSNRAMIARCLSMRARLSIKRR
jgi:hypothetical protein